MAKEAEECSLVEIHQTVRAQEAEEDDPSVVLELTAVAAEARPFHGASHDAEDDGQIDERSRSSSASAAAPMAVRPRTIDAVCPPGSADSEQLEVFPRHYHASRPSRRV